MNRHTYIAGLLAAFLALAAAALAAEPAENASSGKPTDKVSSAKPTEDRITSVYVRGSVEAVDPENRTIQVRLKPPRHRKRSETIRIPPTGPIYRRTEVALADIAVGDILDVHSVPPRVHDLIADSSEIPIPRRRLSATADVIALDPLTLKAGDDIAITLKDPTPLRFRRWQPVELASVSKGEWIGAMCQESETGLTTRWIQLTPVPTDPPIQPMPPKPSEQPVPPVPEL